MFGLSFGELVVLLIVAVMVLGPKELPRYLRKAGQFAGRLRNLAHEMREKSGIDEVLRTEGIDKDIAEIRRLARGEIGGVMSAVRSSVDGLDPRPWAPHRAPGPASAPADTAAIAQESPGGHDAPAHAEGKLAADAAVAHAPLPAPDPYDAVQAAPALVVERSREYPLEGADSYGALPDTAHVYDGSLPASPLAADALYARGEEAA